MTYVCGTRLYVGRPRSGLARDQAFPTALRTRKAFSRRRPLPVRWCRQNRAPPIGTRNTLCYSCGRRPQSFRPPQWWRSLPQSDAVPRPRRRSHAARGRDVDSRMFGGRIHRTLDGVGRVVREAIRRMRQVARHEHVAVRCSYPSLVAARIHEQAVTRNGARLREANARLAGRRGDGWLVGEILGGATIVIGRRCRSDRHQRDGQHGFPGPHDHFLFTVWLGSVSLARGCESLFLARFPLYDPAADGTMTSQLQIGKERPATLSGDRVPRASVMRVRQSPRAAAKAQRDEGSAAHAMSRVHSARRRPTHAADSRIVIQGGAERLAPRSLTVMTSAISRRRLMISIETYRMHHPPAIAHDEENGFALLHHDFGHRIAHRVVHVDPHGALPVRQPR